MPWLAGTALIHSLAVTENVALLKRGLCFSDFGVLPLLTGYVLSSFRYLSVSTCLCFRSYTWFYIFFAYLVVVIGGSLTLYAYKGNQIRSRDNAERYSRETLLLLNNILLMTALCVVLLGTLLPLVHKQLGLGSISIGAPFFDQMFLIIYDTVCFCC